MSVTGSSSFHPERTSSIQPNPPRQPEGSLNHVVSSSLAAGASVAPPYPLTDVEILSIESISQFEARLEREGISEADLLQAYDKLPTVLRDTIEGHVYLYEAERRGAETIAEPDYGKNAVESSIEVLFPIEWRGKFINPSDNLSHLLDLLSAKVKNDLDICYAVALLTEDEKNQIYSYVCEEHAIKNGKPLCLDPGGELFQKYYTRQNLPLLKSYSPKLKTTLWKASLRDSVIATASSINALQYRIPGKGLLDPSTLRGLFMDTNESFETACFLLSSGAYLSDDVLLRVAVFAAEHLRFDDLFLAFNHPEYGPTRYSLEPVFERAARNGLLPDALRDLLSGGLSISENLLGYAVAHASFKGHLPVVQFLLSGGRSISQELINIIFSCAAIENGHLPIVQFFLSDGHSITQEMIENALDDVARNGHLPVVQFLLSMGRLISPQELSVAVSSAASNGHLPIVQFLLSEGRALSLLDRSALILQMSAQGKRDILEFLLQQGPIPRNVRDSAITQAGGDRAGEIRDILRMAPLLPDPVPGAPLPYAGASEEDALYTNFADVKADPKHFLQLVTESFPRRVILLDTPGAIDLGGVTKEFISTLMKALREKEAFPVTETAFPKLINEQGREIYLKLGKFYSLLDQKNTDRTDKFVTGTVFHAGFFQIVHKVGVGATQADLRKEAARQIIAAAPEGEKPTWSAVILDPENPEKLAAYAAILGCTPEDAQDYLASTVELMDQVVNAARAFYEGALLPFQAQIRGTEPVALAHQAQGEPISKEGLIAALSKRLELSEERFGWVREKIEGSGAEWRSRFVKAITGNEVLSPGMKITIGACWRGGGIFEIHTCFNSLDVPSNSDMEKGSFLAALDHILVEGYNTA